ncbi:hypothetical protein MRX96_030940 [Rhipicephalus microplus]
MWAGEDEESRKKGLRSALRRNANKAAQRKKPVKESRCKATSQSCRLLLVENGGFPRTDPFKALGMLRRAPLPCRKLSSFRISAHASPAGAAQGESAAAWASSNPQPPSSPAATQQVLGRRVLPACTRWPVAPRRWWPAAVR